MKVNPIIVLREEFDGSAVLFNPDNGEVYGLNRTALFLWKQLADGRTNAEMLAGLKEKCGDTMPEHAEDDLNHFKQVLQHKGFLSKE